jgi:hypothetical protein
MMILFPNAAFVFAFFPSVLAFVFALTAAARPMKRGEHKEVLSVGKSSWDLGFALTSTVNDKVSPRRTRNMATADRIAVSHAVVCVGSCARASCLDCGGRGPRHVDDVM